MQRVKLGDADVRLFHACKDGTRLCDSEGRYFALFQTSASRIANSDESLQVTNDLAKVLSACEGGVELCSLAGSTIGFLRPVVLRDSFPYWEPKFSKAEWERMEGESGGRTLAEIVRDWKKTA